jgi:hypothetical protein
MTGVMQVVGLGCGEQQLVDAAAHQQRQETVGARPEGAQRCLQRTLQIGDGGGAFVQRGQHVDEDDLAV